MTRRLILRHPDGYWHFPLYRAPRPRRKPCDQTWRYIAIVLLSARTFWLAVEVFPPFAVIHG